MSRTKYTREEKKKALKIAFESKLPPQVFIDAGHTLRQHLKGDTSKLSELWAELLEEVLQENK
jgi:hypothetical protein